MSHGQPQDDYWRSKKLKPGQLLIADVGIQTIWHDREPRLELNEVPVGSIFNENDNAKLLKGKEHLNAQAIAELDSLPPSEQQRLKTRQDEYGWMANLRLPTTSPAQCRWIHVSSKFPEYLQGAFQGLSDWSSAPQAKVEALHEITRCVFEEERFSKHGKMFAPFIQPLVPTDLPSHGTDPGLPILISTPFLDWSLHPRKTVPPLRFQLDEREQFYSSKQLTHPLRSLLQYHYRLEDTSERENSQVYAQHKPWYTDREVDLKVRRWYGHHPAGVVVDELWILVIDARHIITFASNQTWKSRWPPLQVSSRIGEVSFRGIRDMIRAAGGEQKYNSITHAVACLHGAVGLMHRSFWTDMPLPCTDRYGGYLSHLQYRIYRQPSTKLVMDLLQVQDELNIILQITNKQLILIQQFSDVADMVRGRPSRPPTRASHCIEDSDSDVFIPQQFDGARMSRISFSRSLPGSSQGRHSRRSQDERSPPPPPPLKPWLNRFAEDGDPHLFAPTARPIASLDRKLQRELDDLTELRNNANELVNRTIQLVNIRMEGHGQAILVFTVVTIVFLPLSFVSSFFGMNVTEFKQDSLGMRSFWAAGLGLTALVVGLSTILAFYGGKIRDWLGTRRTTHESWKAFRKSHNRNTKNATSWRGTSYSTNDHWT
ncbi:hypothetical protein FH972_025749 [Carpinus fangiana]|uniref:Magnesium transporter n=1 Tax=Carpinus fangiana TaxID=176857 RepID=A0A5N6L1W7_9ROSI|nr:hypothetical protein FH972_025749 [Carpinus fangiana]